MKLDELVRYLDDYLRIAALKDWPGAVNGLQLENAGEVTRVAAGVDACQAVVDAVRDLRADLLLVHHGLYWGRTAPLTGRPYRKFRSLIAGNVAVYAAHLPLDAHPDVGNNAELARLIGLPVEGWWGEVEGVPVGVRGSLDVPRDELVRRVEGAVGAPAHVLPFGPARCRRVGIITGGSGSMIPEAAAAGLDTFIAGEGQHWTFFDAEELGVNVLYAGHYATETLGVKALAAHLERRFGLPWSFVDHPTGL